MPTCKLLDELLQLLHVSAAVVHQVAVSGALLGASSLPTSAELAALCPAWPPEGLQSACCTGVNANVQAKKAFNKLHLLRV